VGKPTGFMEVARAEPPHRPVEQRVRDFQEVESPLPDEQLLAQASRCMDCGVPFCHGWGCPLANAIPEVNDLVYRGRWREASQILHSTNNFPEITGRVCPALCEAACTLSINDEPVLIKYIERRIAERAFAEGWIVPLATARRSGRRIAVVGSGPAGLAAAQQLARAGHEVIVFEKDDRPGGLLRYGIPDFKLPKWVLERRLEQLTGEGVEFQTNVRIGQDISPRYLRRRFDAVLLAMGASQPRDLMVPGRELKNVHFAMEYLTQQNRLNAGEQLSDAERIDAAGKIVVVIGGGDTGGDCVGTAIRQGARAVHQLEILPAPPQVRAADDLWPDWPRVLRTSSSHEEGCERHWSVMTKELIGRDGKVAELRCCRVEWIDGPNGPRMVEKPNSEFTMPAELVLLAMGFVHVEHGGLIEQLGIELDERGNIKTDQDGRTSQPGLFATGDAAFGASLVVRAIASGRSVAGVINRQLDG